MAKKAKKVTAFLLLVFTFPFFVSAQESESDLLKDLVKIANGKMTITDYDLLKQSDGTSIQIKSHCEAPVTGVISRDYLVKLFSMLKMEAIRHIKTDDGATTKTLAEVIGTPDIEISAVMTKLGIQLEVKSAEGIKRNTMQWSDFFQ